MATYDSIHTGEEIDNAVDLVQANASKGDASTPIYFDAEGNAVPITKSNSVTIASTDLITSGAIYNGLATKYNKADISTDVNLGTSNTVISSQGAVKSYVDTQVATRQVPVTAGDYVKIEDNVISLDNTDDFLTIGELNNKVSYFENTELKEGETLIEKMESAKRSTFDLSKFTKVGSPVITDDGIASGFSSGNYITVPSSFLAADTWKIEAPIPQGQTSLAGFICILADACLQLNYNASNKTFYYALSSNNSSWDIVNSNFTISGLDLTLNPIMIVEFTGTKYIFNAKQNGTILTGAEVTSSTKLYNSSNNLGIGINRGSIYPTDGSIDLKGVNILVDGVEVFSGNKTGIDTIKPDNYTVVGTPTISADGIASGLNGANYLIINNSTLGNSLHNANSWKVEEVFKYDGGTDWSNFFSSDELSIRILIIPSQNSRICVILSSDGTNEDIANSYFLSIENLILGNTYKAVIEFTGTQYIFTLYNNDGSVFSSKSINSNVKVFSATNYVLSNQGTNYGSIDLNAFKIYVDGNLVYQPCLKIPYTWTSEGKKIVDSNYRSRVIDEYEQAGFTPYYTLSDTDCTLPTCKESDIVASYESGITKWVQYADFTLKQQGSCSADTTVTLPKKFRDTNYSVTVPYSNKQATSFTPTQAGDWIAIGKTSL